MQMLYIACALTALVALYILLAFIGWSEESPPPQTPSSGAICSPSDSPYRVTPSQQGTYYQPLHRQLSPPRPAIKYPQTPLQYATVHAPSSSRYSTQQASSSSQHSPYQAHGLPSSQYPPQATTPLLARNASVAGPVCYTPQQSGRPAARVPKVPIAPIEIVRHERPAARVPEVPVAPVVIDRHERPAASVLEVPVAPVVIDPHEDPKSLRLKANQEGDRMRKCFKERREAKGINVRQRVKELTLRGEAHKGNMMLLDKEASAKIFQALSDLFQKRKPNTVDLHGLYVPEAQSYFKDAIKEAQDRGASSLCVIVGKGNHSDNNVPKIKPAIQDLGKSLGLPIEVDPRNDGCLIVNFN
ncbi:hypothetical protein DEU56DRAFT_898827 [Suillus clintonianus]|uniref:uncharacterized protein n=1 Tax=Suillus clintonianus TaxID=1904413 RepID=UPI001B87735B|nr:uncharacterized protein DEU56DRAFT_898827 [Suillus clintonianus]KAG2150401.1 hypothetical protein DEU56DRAFT_898827 [Suillus clintonianus]